MLSQIKGEHIASKWNDAWPAIVVALPENEKSTPNLKENILEALKGDTMQLWIMYDKELKVKAVITTFISINNNIGIRELFIYSFFTFEKLTPDEFKQAWLVLLEYASLCGCFTVGAYTNVDSLMDFARHVGGSVVSKVTIPVDRRT